jgi:hypothetical protein
MMVISGELAHFMLGIYGSSAAGALMATRGQIEEKRRARQTRELGDW